MSLVTELRSVPPRLSRSLRRHVALRSMPGPSGHPVLGHMRQFAPAEVVPRMHAWADRYGPIFRCRILHRPVVVVAEPSLVQQLLRLRPHKVRRMRTFEAVLGELRLNGVFSAEGEDWRRQRRLVMSAFGRSKIADMQAMVVRVTDRLLTRWERGLGRPFDAYPDLTRFTADVTTLAAFGYDLDSLRTSAQLQRWVNAVFEGVSQRLFAPLPYWRVFALPRDREMMQALESLRETVQAIVREGDRAGPDNLLRRLQQARLQEGSRRGLSEQELFANVMAMLFAGEDTTANTLGWMLHYLATHPAVQHEVRREVDEVLGDAPHVQTLEQAGALRMVNAAFIETLRLRPVAPVIMLQATQALTLGGYEVPADTGLFALLDREARSAAYFDQPEAFSPQRWLESKVDPLRPSEVLFPFGGGPRICPGRGLAALEVQTLLGSLLRRFELRPAPGAAPPKTVINFTWGPDRIDIVLTPRPG